MSSTGGWRPTPAHARAVLAAATFAAVAVLARRPDLLVLAAPMAGAAVWASMMRPTCTPEFRHTVDHSTISEGETTTWRLHVTNTQDQVDDVTAVFSPPRWIDQDPYDGQVTACFREHPNESLEVTIRPTRWGIHRLSPPLVVAASGWNGFRYVQRSWPDTPPLVTFPKPSHFDAVASPVSSPGLVGTNRSPRYGAGTEFATVRPFQAGDKLRRIHWVESLRTGSLHVTSTWADNDRHVVLIVDAFDEVGESGGIDGNASSLDISVRAAAALSEHFIKIGERVALVTMGAHGGLKVPADGGYSHFRRVVRALTVVRPSEPSFDDGRLPRGLTGGELVIVLSPLLSPGALQRLITISGHGYDVVAIDCLPPNIAAENPSDPYANITWRIERLKRERPFRELQKTGIAIVPWRGRGSLDAILLSLGHDNGARMRRS